MSATRGKLVVLEGIDGAGTTTQARRLVAALEERGHRAHLTREPSDGPIGRLLREILAGGHRVDRRSAGGGAAGDGEPEAVDQTTLSLLFAADRADHLQREVEPALAGGVVVVSDRWYHSSLAYQGTGAERAWIRELNRRARRPDLTIFLEVDPRVGAARRAADDRTEEIFDRLAMQEQVAAGYRATIEMLRGGDGADGEGCEAIDVLDGHAPLDAVSAEILARVLALLG